MPVAEHPPQDQDRPPFGIELVFPLERLNIKPVAKHGMDRYPYRNYFIRAEATGKRLQLGLQLFGGHKYIILPRHYPNRMDPVIGDHRRNLAGTVIPEFIQP